MMCFPPESGDLSAQQHELIMRAFDDWPDDLGGQLLALKDLLQILDLIEERSQVGKVSGSLSPAPPII